MNEKELAEFEELKKRNEQLEKKVAEYEGVSDQEIESETQKENEDWGEDDLRLIDSDAYNQIQFDADYGVLVISLLDHTLILRESARGGKMFIFPANNFGMKKHIPYESMQKIINYNRSFFEKGCFAILDDRFLKKFGLKNAALNLGTMTRMVEGKLPADQFIDFFRSMPEYQRKETVDQMIRAYMDNQDIYSGYFLSRIQADLGLNIAERAENQKQMLDAYKDSSLLKGDKKNE